MLSLPFKSIANNALLVVALFFLFSCKKGEIMDPAPQPNGDTLAIERAKLLPYTEEGRNEAAFLLNGKAKNVTSMDCYSTSVNYGFAIKRMRYVTENNNIPFWVAIVCDSTVVPELRNAFLKPNKYGVPTPYFDTTITIPLNSSNNHSYAVIYGGDGFTNHPIGFDWREDLSTRVNGYGWLKINCFNKRFTFSSGGVKYANAGTFELHLGYNGDTLHLTEGRYDMNSLL